MEELVGIIVPVSVFAMIVAIVYIGATSRHRERMALIEKGADPKLFETVKRPGSKLIKWGMVLLGVGVGVVVGELLVNASIMGDESAYPAMICIFGGLALISAHLYQVKQEEKKAEK